MIEEVVQPVSFVTDGEPEQARAAIVSGDYFVALGLAPSAGRFPQVAREDVPSPVPEVVLSHAYWMRRFGADPSIVGRTVRLNDRPFRLSGVAPIGFTTAQVLWAPDMYVSISETPVLLGTGPEALSGSLYLTARLAHGVSRDAANARLGLLFAQAAQDDSARLARQRWRADDARGITAELRAPALLVSGFLLMIAITVLLVACLNVGNLMLARNATRSREFAVRTALGAPRRRLVQQLAAELGLLAVAGAMLALLTMRWSTALLTGFVPADAGVTIDARSDVTVLAFTATLVAIVLAVAGLVPAMQSTRGDLTASLRDGTPGGSVRRTRLRRWFLGLQVAASTVLVACAGLFLQSLRHADTIEAGFDTSHVLDARLELGRGRDRGASTALLDNLRAQLAELPGVTAVTAASIVPLTGNNSQTGVFVDGGGERSVSTYFVVVAPGYFDALRMPLVAGREFVGADREGAQPVTIVNETFAKQRWPSESAVGKRVSFDGPTGPWMEVIGVSRAIRYNSLGETPPVFLYVPYAQTEVREMTLQLRLMPGASVPNISRAIVNLVRVADPSIPPPRVSTLEDDQRTILLPMQLGAAFTGFLGMLALMLAAVGIFGVAAFEVSQRTKELGIRAALGAPAAEMMRAVLTDTLRTVGIGGAIGLLLALGVARLLASQLYGVGVADPLTFATTPLLLIVVAAIATIVPARRAMSVEPAVAFREE